MKLVNTTAGEVFYDHLFYHTNIPVNTKSVVLSPNQGVLLRGTVLGVMKESGQAVLVDSTKTDGSERADCILTDDIDTGTTEPVVCTAYSSGIFNRKALIVGGTDTVDLHEKELRTMGIYLKDIIG